MGKIVESSGHKTYGPSYEYSLGDELRGERATLGKTLLDIQRELRIRAAYIAAIEDAKPEVFPNAGYIPGYVRSYARHLGLDPEEVFHRFCAESGFVAGGGQAKAAAPRESVKPSPSGFRPDFPMARAPRRMPEIPVGAIGSLLVLLCLVAGLGYGGWMVLQNIQRVQFAPVEELPVAVAEIDPLAAPEPGGLEEPALTELASPVAATALADLYRQQELEVPILVPRDGPIATLDPDATGILARPEGGLDAAPRTPEVPRELVARVAAMGNPPTAPDPQVTATPERPKLTVIAERPAWIRVYLENGTIIFERILETGESYTPPEGTGTPLIWAGNSGSVYVRVGETLHGPIGRGTRAARDILLEPQAVAERFPVVLTVPEVVSQSVPPAPVAPAPQVAVQ